MADELTTAAARDTLQDVIVRARSGARAAVAAVTTVVLGSTLVLACGSRYGDSAEGTAADGGAASATSSGTASPPGTTPAPPTNTTPPGASETPPGAIRCATTAKTCQVAAEQCCVTLTGESTAAVRSANEPTATCMAIDGPNCGSYTMTGSTFISKIPQQCARASDCGAGESCCALPLQTALGTGDRYAKQIGEIVCRPTAACHLEGRILCRTGDPGTCPTTTDCTVETDPVLSRLYAAFCF